MGTGPSVNVISKGQPSELASSLPIGVPSRVAVIRFSSGNQIVLGDTAGSVLSLNTNGQSLWSSKLGVNEIRGMDDVIISGKVHVAIAG
jgi:hypothetical protein